jgi:EmrB/QacA subfamily drug resistance transporter
MLYKVLYVVKSHSSMMHKTSYSTVAMLSVRCMYPLESALPWSCHRYSRVDTNETYVFYGRSSLACTSWVLELHGTVSLITMVRKRGDIISTAKLSAQEYAASFSSKRRTIALVIVALAFVMDLLDSTIVNIAIPSIRTNLGASYSAIQWIVAGYSLAFALLLVSGGRMGDVFGYKKLFMIGVSGFTLASLLSGVAPNTATLIVARVLQGSCAALMVPQVMSLMQVMYKPEERGGINGLFGALGGLSASLGPVIGGLLIKANIAGWDWRPIFLINVPVGIIGLIGAVKYLPDGKSSHPLKLDWFGTVLVVIAMFLLVFPLIQGREYGWPLWTYVLMITSLPVFGVFVWWQKRKDKTDGSPLILPALFKRHSFGVGLGVNLVFEMAMIGFFLTFGLVLQIGLGFSPVHAALTGLPTAFGIALTMAVAGEKLVPKLGRYALSIGAVVMALGLGLTTLIMHHYNQNLHSWQLIPSLLLVGIGMGFVFGSLFAAVLNGVDPQHAGSASGTLNAVQQVGGAIGVALIGVIFFGQIGHGATASFASAENGLRQALSSQHVPRVVQSKVIAATKDCFVDRSREKDSNVMPASCKSTQGSQRSGTQVKSGALQAAAIQANAINFNKAFRWAMIYALGLLVVTFMLSFILPRRFQSQAYAEV